MVEIYNECIYDLLISPNEVHEKLQIQKKGKSIHVPVSILRLENLTQQLIMQGLD